MTDLPVAAILRGPSCPNCDGDPDGIVHQRGLHQDPIVQCFHCAARVYCEGEFRHVVPEDKAPPIRADFLTPRPFNDGLDGFNRMVGTIMAEVAEHERKARYWRGRLQQAQAQRAAYMGIRSETADDFRTVQKPLVAAAPEIKVESEQSEAAR